MLYSFPNQNIYKNNVLESVAIKSFNFLETIIDNFDHKTWDCDIKTSYNITNNILNFPELHSLKMNVLSHIDNFMRLRNNFYNGYIDASWVNVYEKNFYQEQHVHTSEIRRFICGVVYLTKINSSICFTPNYNPINKFEVTPQFSEIIIFNDDLPHSVDKNKNEGLRVSLAFNFKICERG